jgi:hypothetical protein
MLMSRVSYGWWLTLALAAMVFVSTGIRFADLALDRASFSFVIWAGLFLLIDERPRAVRQPA